MSIQMVSFNCVIKNKVGQQLSMSSNRDVLNSEPGQNVVLSGLARGLKNLIKGEKRSISLSASEAYGYYEPKKIILYPRNKLPRKLEVGETISIAGKSGQVRSYKTLGIYDDMARLDGNHPFAGQDLIFEIEATDARSATNEEIAASLNPISSQLLN